MSWTPATTWWLTRCLTKTWRHLHRSTNSKSKRHNTKALGLSYRSLRVLEKSLQTQSLSNRIRRIQVLPWSLTKSQKRLMKSQQLVFRMAKWNRLKRNIIKHRLRNPWIPNIMSNYNRGSKLLSSNKSWCQFSSYLLLSNLVRTWLLSILLSLSRLRPKLSTWANTGTWSLRVRIRTHTQNSNPSLLSSSRKGKILPAQVEMRELRSLTILQIVEAVILKFIINKFQNILSKIIIPRKILPRNKFWRISNKAKPITRIIL